MCSIYRHHSKFDNDDKRGDLFDCLKGENETL